MERVKHIEPVHFERWWTIYPKGEIEREDKQKCLLFYKAAMYRGYTETELHTVLEYYTRYCRQTNKIGTRYVHNPSTFLSEDEHLQSVWESYPEMY